MPTYRDPGLLEFDVVIEGNDPGPGAFVVLPFSVPDTFGVKGRVPVRATFDGIDYRGSISPYGGRHLLGILKGIQRQLGKNPGDTVHVTVRLDNDERTVDVPQDMAAALAEAGLTKTFARLAFTHRREYVTWITQAKRAATRESRLVTLVERLRPQRPDGRSS